MFVLAITRAAGAAPAPKVDKGAVWAPANAQIEHYNSAIAAFNAKNFDLVEHAVGAVLRAQPGCGAALQLMARTLDAENDAARALPYAEAAVAGFPDTASARTVLANTYFVLQRFDEARTQIDAALQLAPEDSESLRFATMVYLRQGDYAAVNAVADAVEAKGHAGDAACYRLVALADQHRSDEARALETACEGAENRSAHDSAMLALAGATGDVDGYVERVQGRLGDAHEQVNLAVAALNEQRWADAAALADQAWRAGYRRPDVLVVRGTARSVLGQRAAADADFKLLAQSDTWIDVSTAGLMTGIMTKGNERAFEDEVRMLMVICADDLVTDGQLDEATKIVIQAEARFGRTAALLAVEAEIAWKGGTPADAWPILVRALEEDPSDRPALSVAGKLAFADPDGLPPAVADAIGAQGQWNDRVNLASGQANAGHADRCLATLAATDPGDDADAKGQIASLGYHCSLVAQDLDAAARWRKDAVQPSPSDQVYHAAQLLQADRAADALALLDGLPLQGDDEISAASIRLGAYQALQDWPHAIALAARHDVDATRRLNLGIALANAQRDTDAATVLRATCPDLQGQNRSLCDQVLEEVDGP